MTKPTKQQKLISVRHSTEIADLYKKLEFQEKHFAQCSGSMTLLLFIDMQSIWYGQRAPFVARKNNKGSPKFLFIQDSHAILRAIPKLWKSCGSSTSPRVRLETGVEVKVWNRTLQGALNEAGYHYYLVKTNSLLNRA